MKLVPGNKGVSKALRTCHQTLLYKTKVVKTILKITVVTNNNNRQ